MQLAPHPAALELLYQPVQVELTKVESLFREQLQNRHPFVNELASYGCMLGGKRLRPALLLLAAKATGEMSREHYTLAAVVEMIHTATLVHDDVLDHAKKRRHLATVNSRWDNEAAVLLGDYLFTQAFYLASTTGSTTACRLIGRATNRVCEGEIRQKGTRGNLQVSVAEYYDIIDGKTAALTECSCQLGAIFAGADEAATHRMGEYGRLIGIAFQIADDILDVVGEPAIVGKTLGTDLEQHKPTLPLIHTLANCSESERQTIADVVFSQQANRAKLLLPLLEKYNAIAFARKTALDFVARALDEVGGLPVSNARDTLIAMTDFVVQRAH